MKFYVVMTDTFLSGWGYAKDKLAKFINVCDSKEEVKIVMENAKNRRDQKNIFWVDKIPQYDKNKVYAQIKTKKDMPNWYIKNYF